MIVKRATGSSQQPWVSTSPIDGSFYFSGASTNQVATAGPATSILPPAPSPVPKGPITGRTQSGSRLIRESGRMRADIHEGPEQTLQSEAGYSNARPHQPGRRNLLHRTAGPYSWVKLRRTRCEHMSSWLPLKADIPRCSRHVANVPGPTYALTRTISRTSHRCSGGVEAHCGTVMSSSTWPSGSRK